MLDSVVSLLGVLYLMQPKHYVALLNNFKDEGGKRVRLFPPSH